MNCGQMIAKLTRAEVSSRVSPDGRRVLRAERFALLAAASGDRVEVAAAVEEARRVYAMWVPSRSLVAA